ncbi:hypothetical protein LTR36_003763 [Oleoguttula mirabilis]|uniref:Phenol 2-monooxygenase n=1 Tax=Oleoguttula mirabilis TaxID=1507867 RepID=A0AAV9JI14_9PEZI|nr:hypothetical protein LTR36_003763 [Oleoguttula mirabilis]
MAVTDASQVDVLIIGAGPAGLMLATWLARTGIIFRIVDKKASRINSGQADGLQSRTFEVSRLSDRKSVHATYSFKIFDSLGIGQDIWREANHMLEIRFWNPDKRNLLYRSDSIVDTPPGLSRFQQATLHQTRIEDHLLGYIGRHSPIQVERGVMPESLSIDTENVDEDGAYPVSVTTRHLPNPDREPVSIAGVAKSAVPNGLFRSNLAADTSDTLLQDAKADAKSHTETIHAKYVVGCDGAHSWVRRQIGSVMEGEQTDYIWGVLDIIPITDFRSMMIIPRENKFVRLYIQVTEVDEDRKASKIDRSDISPETLLRAASNILAPYTLSYKHCHWWTAYQIGQRVGSKYSSHERVFLAGDAVHTHSPKAGQGMNISMHDTYNLGWKLASVIQGRADRSLLKTYSTERRQIAQELIEFDQKFSRLFSGRPGTDIMGEEGIDLKTFKQVFEKGNLFSSGLSVDYAPSLIVAKPQPFNGETPLTNGDSKVDHGSVVGKHNLATGIPIGMRIPSHKVLNQADARPWHLQELLPSNGAWRILVFAGDIIDPAQSSRYEALGKALNSPDSFLHRYRPNGESVQPCFEVLTIHSSPRKEVELLSLPDIFHPFSEDLGWDYNKVFVDDLSYHEGHGQAYDNYGIDPRTGCVVVVRPDQYVSWVGELEDVGEMDRFFGSFMRVQA